MTTVIVVVDDDNEKKIEVSEQAQRHVLRTFNVTADTRVDMSKALCAGLIQQMIDLRNDPASTNAHKRGASIAITLIEGAQMAAVKANFAQE
jgi:hypothetical protein